MRTTTPFREQAIAGAARWLERPFERPDRCGTFARSGGGAASGRRRLCVPGAADRIQHPAAITHLPVDPAKEACS